MGAWGSYVLHGFVPLVEGTVGGTVGFVVFVTVFFWCGVVGLVAGAVDSGADIEVGSSPDLGAHYFPVAVGGYLGGGGAGLGASVVISASYYDFEVFVDVTRV